MKTLANIIAPVGFLFFIGSAGAGQAGTISLAQTMIQMLIGVIMFIGGAGIGIYLHQK